MSNSAERDWIGLVVGVLPADAGCRLLGLGAGRMGGGVGVSRRGCAEERLLEAEYARRRCPKRCGMVSSGFCDSIADIVVEFVSPMDFSGGYSADVRDSAPTLEGRLKSNSPISVSSLLEAVADDLKTLNKNLKSVSNY